MSSHEAVEHHVSKKFKSSDPEEESTFSKNARDEDEINPSSDVSSGFQSDVKEAGPYYLGPVVKKYVRTPATQCLARKKNTDNYYLMKILVLNGNPHKDKHHLQRRTVFHTEYSILSLLKNHPGVIQLHDFFKDSVSDKSSPKNEPLTRMCMVLECLIPHGSHNAELIPLTHYVKEKKKLSELEALHIFHSIVTVVDSLHDKNIVHKDLKLSNIILNRHTLKIKLINFYYAKLLTSDKEVMYDPRGSPPYSAPDMLTRQPTAPKPCEMWSLGVTLYTMLHGHLPFTSSPASLVDLYSKIITTDYAISNDLNISDGTKKLIRSLLCKCPHSRLKAKETVDMVSTLLALHISSQTPSLFGDNKDLDHVVPEGQDFENKEEGPQTNCSECWLIVNSNTPSISSKTYKIAISEVDPKNTKPKNNRMLKLPDQFLSGEKDVFSKCCHVKQNTPTRRNSISKNSKIKFAMLRLGATSVNNITALSFNYSARNVPKPNQDT